MFFCFCFTLDAHLLSCWLHQLFWCRYEPFDFHKECKAMKWYRLSLLMDRIAAEQQQFGFVAHLHIIGHYVCPFATAGETRSLSVVCCSESQDSAWHTLPLWMLLSGAICQRTQAQHLSLCRLFPGGWSYSWAAMSALRINYFAHCYHCVIIIIINIVMLLWLLFQYYWR